MVLLAVAQQIYASLCTQDLGGGGGACPETSMAASAALEYTVHAMKTVCPDVHGGRKRKKLSVSPTGLELCHIAAHLVNGTSNVISLVGSRAHQVRQLPVLRVRTGEYDLDHDIVRARFGDWGIHDLDQRSCDYVRATALLLCDKLTLDTHTPFETTASFMVS
jgi:hypothetical protein